MKILFADDDVDFRNAYSQFLRSKDFSVVEADNGKTALKYLEQQPFDVAIIDVFMPEKEGIEVISRMKREYPQVRILAISGGSFHIDASLSLKWSKSLGAQEILKKPFSAEELLARVMELMKA